MKRRESIVNDLACLLAAVVFVLGFFVLGVRLKYVQVDSASDYIYQSVRQAERRVLIAGPRGRILDRSGRPLAENRRTYSIVCHAESFQRKSARETVEAVVAALNELGSLLGRRSRLGYQDVSNHVWRVRTQPIVAWTALDARELAVFSERECDMKGFECIESMMRVYPQSTLAAHAIGWVGRGDISSEAGDVKYQFREKELFGKSGLEYFYNDYLRGVPGEDRVLVDAQNYAIRTTRVVDPKSGPDLRTTIDIGIQREVERQLLGLKGACVVLDPRTGDLLAFASAPTYDLNVVRWARQYRQLKEDPALPLLNRASGGTYAPGSTFKPVTALAALGMGVPPSHEHECTGLYNISGMDLHCSRRWGHGALDLRHALMASCNPYFCDLGVDIGTNALVTTARALGLGSRTGLDLSIDARGVVPTAEWKMQRYHEPWYSGDVAQMSIGQGMLLATPLQMAMLTGAIGTGSLVVPRFRRDAAVVRKALPFSERDLAVVREGMRMVVSGDGETAGSGKHGGEGVAVAVSGKTGTAEVGVGESRRKNAWFVAYAPSDTPTVAIALIVEDGISGGATSAPKVAAILRRIFGTIADAGKEGA